MDGPTSQGKGEACPDIVGTGRRSRFNFQRERRVGEKESDCPAAKEVCWNTEQRPECRLSSRRIYSHGRPPIE